MTQPALPVARVSIDASLPHLDRPFDYLVPETMDAAAVPGSRVRVRFAGRLVDGFILERAATSDHVGALTPIGRSVSAEAVLSPDVARLARAVADRCAGTLTDVLRLAIPPRHARVEAQPSATPIAPPAPPDPRGWSAYDAGAPLLAALADGRSPRAAWTALPGPSWPDRIAEAVQATLAGGRGATVVVPDRRDLDRVDAALTAALGPGAHVRLSADLGPAERYRRWLAVRRGAIRAVVGSRAAAFAPVADLGLVVLWDDGDDVLAEPRAPYCHTRDVLLVRADLAGAAALLGGFSRTAEVEQLLGAGWARPLVAPRSVVRAAAPRVRPTGGDADLARDPGARSARLPTLAWQGAKDSLEAGAPVLIQVPRRGYLPALACARCRATARCPACAGSLGQGAGSLGQGAGSLGQGAGSLGQGAGPLGQGAGSVGQGVGSSSAVPSCRLCGRLAGDWSCPACAGRVLRAAVVGARRTAEELGRAFPGVLVRTSGREEVLASVPSGAALVVSTPGAEPVADGGYGTVLLLDAWALLTRADLRAGEETLRRWFAAAALARPAADGGQVIVAADGSLPCVQALLRWDPAWHAERELADRVALGFPPATRVASVSGTPAAVAELIDATALPEGTQVLGPVPLADGRERSLLRASRRSGAALASALAAAQAVRSARKAGDPVRVELDPLDLL